jgi:DNA modification methylase
MTNLKPYYADDWATIYHGDCRTILPSLGRFDLCLTDPPYGIGFAAQPTKWQRLDGMKPSQWDSAVPSDCLLESLQGISVKQVIPATQPANHFVR